MLRTTSGLSTLQQRRPVVVDAGIFEMRERRDAIWCQKCTGFWSNDDEDADPLLQLSSIPAMDQIGLCRR